MTPPPSARSPRPLLAASLAALLSACDTPPKIELVGASLPPRFKVAGSARTFGVLFTTPGAPIDGSPRYDVLWHLRPRREGTTPSDAPEFTYGTVPPGLQAIRFEATSTRPAEQTEAPPPLVPGRVYIASLSTSAPNLVSTSHRDARVCFMVDTNAVTTAPCPAH